MSVSPRPLHYVVYFDACNCDDEDRGDDPKLFPNCRRIRNVSLPRDMGSFGRKVEDALIVHDQPLALGIEFDGVGLCSPKCTITLGVFGGATPQEDLNTGHALGFEADEERLEALRASVTTILKEMRRMRKRRKLRKKRDKEEI